MKVRQASVIYRIKSSLTKAARLQRFAYVPWRVSKCFRFWDRADMGRTIVDSIDMSITGSGRSRCSFRVQVDACDFTVTTSETLPSKIKFSAVNLNAWCSMYSLELAGRHVRRRLCVERFQLFESTSEALRCHTTVGHTVVSRHEIQAECISTWCCIMLAIS